MSSSNSCFPTWKYVDVGQKDAGESSARCLARRKHSRTLSWVATFQNQMSKLTTHHLRDLERLELSWLLRVGGQLFSLWPQSSERSTCLSPFWKKLRIFIQILLILFSHFKTPSNLAWLYGLAVSHYLVVLDLNEAEIWTGKMGMGPTSRTKIWTVKELPMVKQFPNERIKLVSDLSHAVQVSDLHCS